MLKFLVTGGAGFIGSHITERLLKNGYFVRVLDNFSSGKRENLSFAKDSNNFELIEGDIRDRAVCAQACQNIDYVLHQAALRSVPKSIEDPQAFNEVNINGILFMLQAASKAKVRRFVFASSSSVYGDTDRFPEKEDFLPKPFSPYALTKLAGEYYCRIFSEHFNLQSVCLRYFNVFGPKQALDDEYAVVVPKFITSLLNGQKPPIFGTGKQSRDFTYIDNVVEANILAATSSDIKYAVLNVANGKDHTVLQLLDYLNKILNKEIKPVFLAPRPGDVFRTCANISQIRKILKFKPKVDFLEGLKRTVDWFKNGPLSKA